MRRAAGDGRARGRVPAVCGASLFASSRPRPARSISRTRRCPPRCAVGRPSSSRDALSANSSRDALLLLLVERRGVRADEHVRVRPQRRVGRQRLGLRRRRAPRSATRPSSSAATSDASSTTVPRPTLTRMAPGFTPRSTRSPMRWSVAAVPGRVTTIASTSRPRLRARRCGTSRSTPVDGLAGAASCPRPGRRAPEAPRAPRRRCRRDRRRARSSRRPGASPSGRPTSWSRCCGCESRQVLRAGQHAEHGELGERAAVHPGAGGEERCARAPRGRGRQPSPGRRRRPPWCAPSAGAGLAPTVRASAAGSTSGMPKSASAESTMLVERPLLLGRALRTCRDRRTSRPGRASGGYSEWSRIELDPRLELLDAGGTAPRERRRPRRRAVGAGCRTSGPPSDAHERTAHHDLPRMFNMLNNVLHIGSARRLFACPPHGPTRRGRRRSSASAPWGARWRAEAARGPRARRSCTGAHAATASLISTGADSWHDTPRDLAARVRRDRCSCSPTCPRSRRCSTVRTACSRAERRPAAHDLLDLVGRPACARSPSGSPSRPTERVRVVDAPVSGGADGADRRARCRSCSVAQRDATPRRGAAAAACGTPVHLGPLGAGRWRRRATR